ncbi:MAG: plastocyanin/azurin family copper-binding protein [Actinomycetota bacterium]
MSEFRKRVLEPALIPLGAFLFIGVLAYAVSRILLAVTKEGSVVVATLMAACVLFAAAAVAKGGVMKNIQKVALIAFSLMLLAGGIAVEASLGPREVEGHLEVAAKLVAQNLQFDKKEFTVPADEHFGLELDNRDAQPHNVAIYTAKGQLPPLFTFPPFSGPASRVFESDEDGIPEGVYYFQCDVHPSMNGTATAGEATGPATPPPSPPAATGPPAAEIDLTARDTLTFDKTTLTFPADTSVTINLINEGAVPHNWSLYRDDTATDPFFTGEIFSGPAEKKYTFTSPGPGSYFYRCDVHPTTMTGTATVT